MIITDFASPATAWPELVMFALKIRTAGLSTPVDHVAIRACRTQLQAERLVDKSVSSLQ